MLFDYMNARKTFWFFQTAVLGYFISLTFLVGVSRFSPDSWSYFELSKTVFSDDFYAFNTYRSYFSLERSTSFPFGFPVLLALVNSQFGWEPENAALFNGLLAALVFFLIYNISRRFKLEHIPAIALGIAFVFWPGFLDEVVSGRAYPAALVALLFGLVILTKTGRLWPVFVGAFFIGISTNIRFDFIFGAWAAMTLFLLYFHPTVRAFSTGQIGFVVGGLPWVIYSLYFFDTPWVSDNSWVSMASHLAFVTDFPAASFGTIFSEPMDWAVRILKNVLRLIWALFTFLPDYPLLLAVLAGCVLFLPFQYLKSTFLLVFFVFFVLSLAFVPYLLTGYFDQRYFSLFFLGASLGLLVLFSVRGTGAHLYPVLSTLTLAVVFLASMYWAASARNVQRGMEGAKRSVDQINLISSCQDREPGVTYFFASDVDNTFVFRYGAVTGHRVAVRPSNLDWFDAEAVGKFLFLLGPTREVNELEFQSCAEFFSTNPPNVGRIGNNDGT